MSRLKEQRERRSESLAKKRAIRQVCPFPVWRSHIRSSVLTALITSGVQAWTALHLIPMRVWLAVICQMHLRCWLPARPDS